MEYIPVMKVLFSSLLAFAATFFLVYIPLAIIIGWYDYRRFAVPGRPRYLLKPPLGTGISLRR